MDATFAQFLNSPTGHTSPTSSLGRSKSCFEPYLRSILEFASRAYPTHLLFGRVQKAVLNLGYTFSLLKTLTGLDNLLEYLIDSTDGLASRAYMHNTLPCTKCLFQPEETCSNMLPSRLSDVWGNLECTVG